MKLLRYTKLTKYQQREFLKHIIRRIALLSFVILTLFEVIPYIFLGMYSIALLFFIILGTASRFVIPELFNDLLRKRVLEDDAKEKMELSEMEEPLMWIQTITILAICATQVWIILFIAEASFMGLSILLNRDVDKILQKENEKQERLTDSGFEKENTGEE